MRVIIPSTLCVGKRLGMVEIVYGTLGNETTVKNSW